MNRRLIFILTLSFFSIGAFAQSDIDAYKLSKNDLRGSARAVAMGGAFGALGGDMTGVAINPAGIGAYTSAEIATTMSFQNTKTKANWNLGVDEMNKFKFNFDNISYVGVAPIPSDAISSINFGFAFNRLKNFDRQFNARGANQLSLSHYMANRANNIKGGVTEDNLAVKNNGLEYYDWLSVLGYNTWLIEPTAENSKEWQSSLLTDPSSTYLMMKEKGRVDSYDFNFGFDISEIIGVGVSLSITDIDYSLYSEYDESLTDVRGFTLRNWLSTEGSGLQTKVGVILKPINEFRIGLAYHSPTWYNMTDSYEASIYHDLDGVLSKYSQSTYDPDNNYLNTYNARGDIGAHTDYKLRTPDKWVFSLASVIGQRAILSLDYELANYGNMKLKDDYGVELSENIYIEEDFRLASTLKFGAEFRFTPRISGRIGYAWVQSPLKTEFKNAEEGFQAVPVGSLPHYTLDGDTHHFTYGLGYKISKHFYTDIAFVMKWQEDNFYSFPSKDLIERGTLKTNTFQGLLTLGYKF